MGREWEKFTAARGKNFRGIVIRRSGRGQQLLGQPGGSFRPNGRENRAG